MPRTLKDYFPEKDYAAWLALGLVFLIIGQVLSKYESTLANILHWIFFSAAIINYIVVLYLYERNRIAKKREKEAAVEKPEKNN